MAFLVFAFSLLQELQGFEAEVEQCYESAVASLIKLEDLRFIWKWLCCLLFTDDFVRLLN